jgi:metacaspase-1
MCFLQKGCNTMVTQTRASTKAVTKTAAKPTVRALSLHLGLNSVSPGAYAGWSGPLAACEFDAQDMAALATSQGMKPALLLTAQATRAKFLSSLRAAAKALKSGDFFMLSYSGHGGQMPDTNGDEPDKQDETWCLFDGQLLDDELYFELSRFAAGVRVLVLSDSCHSGSVVRSGPPGGVVLAQQPHQRPKVMPAAVGVRVYAQHHVFYKQLQSEVAAAAAKAQVNPDAALAQVAHVGPAAQAVALVGAFKPAVVLISGCQDNQTSMDGDHNGAFTEQLLKVWNHGAYSGANYASLHAHIKAGLPPTQSPNLFTLGRATAFLAQKPFQV